jgi:hypothetical protein
VVYGIGKQCAIFHTHKRLRCGFRTYRDIWRGVLPFSFLNFPRNFLPQRW